MGCKRVNSTRKCVRGNFVKVIGFVMLLFCSTGVYAQEEDEVVKALVKAGFENVSRVVSGEEIITFENLAWKANGEGVSEAMQIIEQFPIEAGKARRVVVLKYKVPQVSLLAREGEDWKVSYELGKSWKNVREKDWNNNSRRKFDLLFYPQFSLRNQKYHKIYDVLLNIAPTLEWSPLRGMKLTGQLIVPVVNEYGELYGDVRPGFLTLQQSFRVENVFVQATVGNFNQNRWGMDLAFSRPFTKGWLQYFAVNGAIGLTGSSYFLDWNWHFGSTSLFTWRVGGVITIRTSMSCASCGRRSF